MAKADAYRSAIEFATVKAELASSDEIKMLWLNIREQYEYLKVLDASMKDDIPFSSLPTPSRRNGR